MTDDGPKFTVDLPPGLSLKQTQELLQLIKYVLLGFQTGWEWAQDRATSEPTTDDLTQFANNFLGMLWELAAEPLDARYIGQVP